jgi:hypothetical protein
VLARDLFGLSQVVEHAQRLPVRRVGLVEADEDTEFGFHFTTLI